MGPLAVDGVESAESPAREVFLDAATEVHLRQGFPAAFLADPDVMIVQFPAGDLALAVRFEVLLDVFVEVVAAFALREWHGAVADLQGVVIADITVPLVVKRRFPPTREVFVIVLLVAAGT